MRFWRKPPLAENHRDDNGNVVDVRLIATLKHENHLLVLGLTWRALRSTEPSMREEEAVHAAARVGATHAAIVESVDGRAMVGLLPPSTGFAANKVVSGAAWLAAAVDKPTLYIHQLDAKRWWFAAVRPGEIEPNGDLVGDAATVGEAIDQALQDALRDGSEEQPDIVVAGPEFPATEMLTLESPGVRQGDLRHLLPGGKPDVRARFRRLRGLNPMFVLVGIAVLAVVLLVAAGWWWHKQREEDRALEAARRHAAELSQQQQRLASLKETRIVAAVASALRADTATPVPSSEVDRAVLMRDAIDPGAAAWALESVTFTDDGVTTAWRRRAGDLSDNVGIVAYAETFGAIAGVAADGKSATFSIAAPPLPARGGLVPKDLPKKRDVLLHMGTWLQRYGAIYPNVKIEIAEPKSKSITYQDPDPATAGQSPTGSATVPAMRAYQIGTIRVNGTGMDALASFRPDFDYFTITSLTMRFRQERGAGAIPTWNLEAHYVFGP